MSAQHPEEGEVWFVLRACGTRLIAARVVDLTEKTVAIVEVVPSYRQEHMERYRRADIEFVERKSPAPVAPAHVGEGWPKPEE